MKAYSERCDYILQFLNENHELDWLKLYEATGAKQYDGIISFLKVRHFVDFNQHQIHITKQGIDFILNTSFVKQKS
ncbi:MAG: hypothetical protein ABIO04_09680 [Ferruginibacter sp.]